MQERHIENPRGATGHAGVLCSIRRAIIARTDRLGELVLTLSLARKLGEMSPGIVVDMVVAPGMEGLMRFCPDVKSVITHGVRRDAAWLWRAVRLGMRLRAAAYDAILIVNPTKEVHLAAVISGIPVRIGYARKGGQYLLTHAYPVVSATAGVHEVERNAVFLEPLGISNSLSSPRLRIHPQEQHAMTNWLLERGIGATELVVAIHPWASRAFKRWAPERFCQLASRVKAELGMRVVIIGSGVHQEESKGLRGPFTNLTGQTSLSQLAALIDRCVCVVSNDTGPAHVAAAVGTPVIALFGTRDPAASPARWRPWGADHVVIHRDSMEAIRVEEVFAALEQRLGIPVRVTERLAR